MKRNFQTLVVFHQLLVFASVVVQSLTYSWLSPEMREFLGVESSVLDDTQDVMHPGQIPYTLWWGLALISVIASAGALLFRRWGRTLFVAVSVAYLLLIPFGGVYMDVGWTVMVGSAAGITEGMVIALMYFSPLRRLFKSGGGT